AVSLRIGAIESVLHSWLIPWIEKLRRENPALELELSVDTTPILVDQINRGTLDLVFAAMPASADGVRTQALPSMEMVFIGSAHVHRKRRYTLAALGELEILTFQRGSQPHVTLIDMFRQAQVEPRRVHTISSISAMAQLVQGGFGVATLPLQAVQGPLTFPNLKPLACDTLLQPLPIHASYRTDPSSLAVNILVDSALAFVKTLDEPRTRKAKRSGH
ncbi:LysR family transcriptional regulator substrate-binding protein, partial [Hydrogenophaga sp.]|uniref:LysR family transcriptional regulator substrate-binding protein n=1 Tax=Hydrogenophaga sp. TaxID=1904254 RepID=UPI00356B563E